MTSAELTLPIATSIAAAVTDLRGVAKLSPGRFGEVALLFPGERVHGIRRPNPQDDTHLELHIVVDVSAGVPLAELGDVTRTTVRTTWPAVRRVDVVFDDAV
ncbi:MULTISPECIES: hypothetical protein [unclassified Corynebacterium]|uniref:hypothetical protein n=1 Tax=unclassified Corynebacterium TaxID=2624378 RepID=UPI0008A1A2B8|nr:MULTISPECIES: hypothetical protein [unclassified Corynebacterium]OFK60539.1 hypothetical protein HMPREF2808_06170 [Corynebacterium sp. HMSC078A10]OFN76610.1 hypothetical protein HMPREF2537_08470 [Corynebacterium sp. HMSC074E01]OFP63401.1 hypothetical protein HMPREF2978_11430 [Corynebacterium sp. HMSC074C01]